MDEDIIEYDIDVSQTMVLIGLLIMVLVCGYPRVGY